MSPAAFAAAIRSAEKEHQGEERQPDELSEVSQAALLARKYFRRPFSTHARTEP